MVSKGSVTNNMRSKKSHPSEILRAKTNQQKTRAFRNPQAQNIQSPNDSDEEEMDRNKKYLKELEAKVFEKRRPYIHEKSHF